MKNLVMTLVFAASSLVNGLAGNVESKFAYNVEKDGEQITSQTVYQIEESKYLKQHLKYEFQYDAANRLIQKEAWKWNADAQTYEHYYCLNYHYADDEVTLEYTLWNEKAEAYDAANEKAVYQLEAGNVNYFAFEWNRHLQDWNLMVSHDTWAAQEVQLLAEK